MLITHELEQVIPAEGVRENLRWGSVAWMSVQWDDREVERGWCSHCVTLTEHTREQMTWLPGLWRSAYKCNSCGVSLAACAAGAPPAAERALFWRTGAVCWRLLTC